METPTIIQKPKVEVDPEIIEKISEQVHEMGQVVVHCILDAMADVLIRIWPTTVLYDLHSDHVSDMVHVENITIYPQWQQAKVGKNYFTLIFSGLPKNCIAFNLIEHCSNQGGAFQVLNVTRNESDVYFVKL